MHVPFLYSTFSTLSASYLTLCITHELGVGGEMHEVLGTFSVQGVDIIVRMHLLKILLHHMMFREDFIDNHEAMIDP